ncbi:uncharacterized protein LOC126672695 [Mercurialis annua]|uniref:uncharacterized protein LOC126672695 n=1 Tax=Mercurialis annua TaxID=3986 RepID=UPI00215ED619|nr:uncharacterized protein LOC126672695 [Mercurialis annua]
MSPLSLRVDRFQSTSLVDWVNSMLTTLKADELQLFVLSLWSIWNDRNNIVFGNRRLAPDMLFSNILSMHSGGSSGHQVVISEVRSQNQTWNPPPPHAVKLNTDAAVSIDKKMSVAGAVCRNSEGVVLKSGVCVMQGIYDVELAEAMAVEFGVKMAAYILCEELIVESDSLNVIQRFHKHDGAIDHIQLIIEDCIAIPLSCSVRFQHARRSYNIVAHAMAKWGMFIGRNRLFDGEVPFPVNELIVIPS